MAVPGRRACDACHSQKIKCLVDEDRISRIPTSSFCCQSCRSLRLACTFDRPQRRRPRTKFQRDPQGVERRESLSTEGALPSLPSSTIGIESICSRDILDEIINDYIQRLYCLTPLIHKASFRQDLDEGRAERDPLFFSFVFCLCTWVCSMLPVHFMRYQGRSGYFPYKTVSEMVNKCETTVMSLRGRREFEQPTNLHCGIAFALYQGTAMVGLNGRSRIFGAELDAVLKTLGANTPHGYDGLSLPEQQVRKKLFWLNFFIQTHGRLGDQVHHHLNWLPIPDTMFYDPAELEAILPFPSDDEYITNDELLEQPHGYVGIKAGFLGIIRIFLCFVAPMAGHPQGRVIEGVTGMEYASSVETARQRIDRKMSDDLQDMLLRVHRVADQMPRALALWLEPGFQPSFLQEDLADQLASMRANIHVTRLWARYLIFDRLVSVQEALYGKAVTNRSLIISEHEAICDDLLQFLSSVTIRNLESNGIPISFKIRQVAALLLDYSPRAHTVVNHNSPEAASPDEQHQHRLAERADSLIDKFLTLLTKMDSTTFQDSQMMLCNLSQK